MKQQYIIYLLLLLFPIYTLANHVHWLGSYSNALHQAHKEEKPLLVLVVKKDDASTHTVLKNTLMNQPYIDTINQKMIAVMVTYEGRSSYPVEMYYTTQFPALFFVNTKSETFMKEPLYDKDINTSTLSDILQNL